MTEAAGHAPRNGHPTPSERMQVHDSVRLRAAHPSAEVRLTFLPSEQGVALTVQGLIDDATFPLVRAAVLTVAAGVESLTVDLRQAVVRGGDLRVLLTVLERRMRRFGRQLNVLDRHVSR